LSSFYYFNEKIIGLQWADDQTGDFADVLMIP